MLVLRPGALGDTLLVVPALRALRARFGDVRLAGHAGAARLLEKVGEVDRGMAFDDPALGWLFRDVPPPTGEKFVAWMQPGSAPALRYAVVVAPSRAADGQPTARYLLETLAPLGVDTATLDDRPLNVSAITSDEVLVHPGSGAAAKNWSSVAFADVIRQLARPVRLVVGEADAAAAAAVESAFGMSLPRLENVGLAELAMRLAGCAAYLGNDSGVSHLAGLCGARTVVLFGPTSPETWRPLGPDVHVETFNTPPARIAATLQP